MYIHWKFTAELGKHNTAGISAVVSALVLLVWVKYLTTGSSTDIGNSISLASYFPSICSPEIHQVLKAQAVFPYEYFIDMILCRPFHGSEEGLGTGSCSVHWLPLWTDGWHLSQLATSGVHDEAAGLRNLNLHLQEEQQFRQAVVLEEHQWWSGSAAQRSSAKTPFSCRIEPIRIE